MNPRKDPNKKPPCSFKGTCRNFVAKQPCNFSHDPCPYIPNCKFAQKCNFYHPQVNANGNGNMRSQNQSRIFNPSPNQSQTRSFNPSPNEQRKPVSQTQCKFGMTCNKRLAGLCHFLHTQNGGQSRPNIDTSNVPCRHATNCIKFKTGTCKFLHTQSDNQSFSSKNQIGFSNLGPFNQQSSFPLQPAFPSRKFPVNNQPAFENSICMKFTYNQCNFDDSQCPERKQHTFTNQNTIKRVFYNGKKPLNAISGCYLLPIDRATFFTLHLKERLIFMKFNEVKKTLQPVSDLIFKETSEIVKIIIENSLIIYFLKSINFDLVFYKPKTGRIQKIKNVHFNDILGLAYIESNNILISIAKGQKANVFLDQQETEEGKLKFNDLLQIGGSYNNLNFIKKVILMDEQLIIGGSQSGKICIWNNKLDGQIINLHSPKYVQDAQCAVCSGHPYCFVSVLDTQKQTSQVLIIDLLSFQTTTVLENKGNYRVESFKKMLVLNQLFLVQLATGNILIYKLPNFNRRIGIIPLSNQAISMQKQKDCSKFFIAQKSGIQSEGSFSIYKLNI